MRSDSQCLVMAAVPTRDQKVPGLAMGVQGGKRSARAGVPADLADHAVRQRPGHRGGGLDCGVGRLTRLASGLALGGMAVDLLEKVVKVAVPPGPAEVGETEAVELF